MFTGIIQTVGTVTRHEFNDSLLEVDVTLPQQHDYAVGDSVAVNGICSTVTAIQQNTLTVQYMEETTHRTTVAQWDTSIPVNVESPLRLQDKLSGSIVNGHIDAVATLTVVHTAQDSHELWIEYGADWSEYVIPKGSITIDGVNLTIVDVQPMACSVHIIPHTWKNTIIQHYSKGDSVNIEFDYFAKFVRRLMDHSVVPS